MNERIRELRRQATLVETYTTNSGAVAEGKHVDFEKFAELIVQECVKVSVQTGLLSEAGFEGEIVANAIKEHFGFKE